MNYLYLAEALSALLEKHITTVLERNADASVRPVLVGPPAEVLETLFNLLTAKGTRDWQIARASRDVVVLYVQGLLQTGYSTVTPASMLPLSKICQWDYAVTARNNSPIVVKLIYPRPCEYRHDSLANTTDTLGGMPSVHHDQQPTNVVLYQIN